MSQKKTFSIGFVPTMGAIHDGHLSLTERSLKENDLTIVSIFINPTQFNNPDDLAKYPRTLEADIYKIKNLNPSIIIYAPTIEDIYGNSPKSEKFDFDGLEYQLEGKFRAGHFDGVGTIVKYFFEIISPTRAYFGEKDFQQLQIIRKLVSKYNFEVDIVGCPVFREKNNLAMSSRNELLTTEEREKASIIYESLTFSKSLFATNSPDEILFFVKKYFENNTLFSLEYFEIADETTLLPYQYKYDKKKYRAFIAVFARQVRLIDTIALY